MGREGWLYAAVFLLVLGAGGILIGPRLVRLSQPRPPAVEPEAPGASVPPAPPSPSEAPPPSAEAPEVEVVLLPEGGRVDPLAVRVWGAEVRARRLVGDEVHLRLRREGDLVELAVPGHARIRHPAAALASGSRWVLPRAAPPVVLTVTEADGRPAVDVPVGVRPAREGAAPRTDPEGRLVLDDLHPGLVRLDVGERERTGPSLLVRAGLDREVRAVLEPAWEIRGRLVDPEGRGLEGAAVRGALSGAEVGRTTRTDGEGAFVWRGPVVGQLAFELLATGWAPRAIEVEPPWRGTLTTSVGDVAVVSPEGTIAGRVGGDGRGTEGARLSVEPAVAALLRELFGAEVALGTAREAVTDADGRYVVRGLPVGLPLRVALRGAGLPLDATVTLAAGETRTLDLTPLAGSALEGWVLDAQGGVPGLAILLGEVAHDGPDPAAGERLVRTDATGRFVFQDLPRGRFYLRAYPGARRPLLRTVDVPAAEPLELRLEPEGEGAVAGVVVDDTNRPLAGVTVRAAGRATVTGPDGRFRLTGVEAFGPDVEVRASFEAGSPVPPIDPRPFAPGVRRRVPIAPSPVKLVLPRTRALFALLVDGIDDAPLPFVHVVIRTDEGEVLVDRPVATVGGRVRFEGLPARGLVLTLLTSVHRRVEFVPIRADVDEGADLDLGTVRVAHGMRVEGRITDEEGRPLLGARIGGVEDGWLRTRSSDPTVRRELAFRHVQADREGRYVLEGFDPRRDPSLTVWAPGFAPASRRVVLEDFRDDVTVHLDVALRRGGWLVAQLVERGSNRPVPGAVFDLEDARNGSGYLHLLRRGMLGGVAASDDDWLRASERFLFERETEGTYELGPIAAGPYQVWVERPGYRPIRPRLTILDAAEDLVDAVRGTSRPLRLVPQIWELEPAPGGP